MTEWIVSNAWWFAPALTFAGVGMFVGALLWPRKVALPPDSSEQAQHLSALVGAASRRGRHLRTD